jgi:predicted small secreted protein
MKKTTIITLLLAATFTACPAVGGVPEPNSISGWVLDA